MKRKIEKVLKEFPGSKGSEIARKLDLSKKEVNSFLAHQSHNFVQDENYCWFIKEEEEMKISLPGDAWINGLSLDKAVKSTGSPLTSNCEDIVFVVPQGSKIFLEASSRLLALCNQLDFLGKNVTIDFSDCQDTLIFFDRIGFMDHLRKSVAVVPYRPEGGRASRYKGNAESVYEFGEIDPADLDEGIPKRLKESFVHYASAEYAQPAFTVLSELFSNVRDHSESPFPGYIALQYYKGHGGRNSVAPHIQTIVSDSGKGITGSLMPVLRQKYPDLYEKFDFNDPSSRPKLVQEVFQQGQISSSPDEGRGLGLKRSRDVAANYNASISVREDTFELRMSYKNGKLSISKSELDLPKMMGCHICFDFILAKS